MGGLVIKKVRILATLFEQLPLSSFFDTYPHRWQAYILAQNLSDIKNRIRAIFFLATPQHGSDYAATLNNILSVFGIIPARHYISDLTAGSISMQVINDDFGKLAHELPVVSFYETLKTNLGLSSIIVVDRESSVLGMVQRHLSFIKKNKTC